MRKSIVLLFAFVYLMADGAAAQQRVKASSEYTPLTGILGAFADETELLLSQVQQKKEIVLHEIRFTRGVLKGRQVV
ncbi:MAG: hypothetical protein JST39_14935, partial [Bacteroidetes bacterium]|nr:hypothetical protein [Bacteroidota bacterium]